MNRALILRTLLSTMRSRDDPVTPPVPNTLWVRVEPGSAVSKTRACRVLMPCPGLAARQLPSRAEKTPDR